MFTGVSVNMGKNICGPSGPTKNPNLLRLGFFIFKIELLKNS